nr:unnamed protein product [Digitaria exilis]
MPQSGVEANPAADLAGHGPLKTSRKMGSATAVAWWWWWCVWWKNSSGAMMTMPTWPCLTRSSTRRPGVWRRPASSEAPEAATVVPALKPDELHDILCRAGQLV